MTVTYFLLGLVLLLIAVLFHYVLVRGNTLRSLDSERSLTPISTPALLNLVDVANLEFLERSLPRHEFRKACLERNRVLRIYVHRILHNTRILIASAEGAQSASDPAIAAAAHQLLQLAFETRVRAVRALIWLYLSEVIPGSLPNVAEAVRVYQSATTQLSVVSPRAFTH